MDKPENVEINKIKYLSTLNPQKLWITIKISLFFYIILQKYRNYARKVDNVDNFVDNCRKL